MAGVFKHLDASDIRLVPFQTHKKWNDAVNYTNYYGTVLIHPINVGGLYGVANRAYATDVSSSRILRLDSSDEYTVLSTITIPNLSGSKYTADRSQGYVAAHSVSNNKAVVSMLSSTLGIAVVGSESGSYTSSVVTIPRDTSYVPLSNSTLVYVAGQGGVTAFDFNDSTGVFSSATEVEYQLDGLGPSTNFLTSSVYVINGEQISGGVAGFLGVSVTGSDIYAFATSGDPTAYPGPLQLSTYSLVKTAPGVLPKTLIYSNSLGYYYLLLSDGYLYEVDPNASATLKATGVADILQDRTNFVPGTNTYRDTKIHVVYETGEVGLDYSAGSYEKVVDARQWVARKPTIKATIQYNDPSGSIGIFAGSTSSLGESVFFTINPYTYEISDPIHMGATKGDLRISGTNLSNFVGFSSSFNNRFIEFDLNTSTFQHYKADYNPQPSHPSYNPLNTLFDQGNPTFQFFEPITANGKFQRVVHHSTNHLFFQHFYDNTKATFGSGNVNTQNRFIEDQAHILNMPQSKFGEAIQQGSVLIQANYSISQSKNNTLTIVDDIYGNLYVSGGFVSSIDGTTLISGSVSASTVGEWPTLDLYKYNTKGPVTFTSSFNKGNWCMQTNYTNVAFTTITGSSAPLPQPIDMLGVVPIFSSSISSSIEIKPGPVLDYKQNYNFENGDFTITMMVRASATSSHASGSILIAKQGTEEDTAVDINGNPYTYLASNRSPYRVSFSGSSTVIFERDNLFQQVKASGSISLNQLHHVAVMKTGSQLRVYVDGTLQGTAADVDIVKGCSNKGNITIGNLYTGNRGFDGMIDNVKVYNSALSTSDLSLSRHTLGHNSTIVGNVFYNQGMMVLGAVPARFMDIESVTARGTHTIWEKEISCTIGAGEFNRSNNPTLQVYNPASNQYEFRPFTTGSFKPYVTTVGLYDDRGRMLAVAKLATPLQLPDNVDTTIVVRYDS